MACRVRFPELDVALFLLHARERMARDLVGARWSITP